MSSSPVDWGEVEDRARDTGDEGVRRWSGGEGRRGSLLVIPGEVVDIGGPAAAEYVSSNERFLRFTPR